jgi:hypothetical protein
MVSMRISRSIILGTAKNLRYLQTSSVFRTPLSNDTILLPERDYVFT